MRFTLEQLSAFVAVAEKGSFSKAARHLHKDRATIHSHVGNLEVDLNVTLFDRSKKFPVLTTIGKSLLAQAKQILYRSQLLESCADSISNNEERKLTIYYDNSLSPEMLNQINAKVAEQYRFTQLNWYHRGYHDSINAIEAQQCDIALALTMGKTVPSIGASFTNLGYPKFAFYCHKNSELSKLKVASMADLEQHKQYILENLMEATQGRQISISTNISIISNLDLLLSMMKKSGWAVLPCHVMESPEMQKQFQKVELDFMIQEGRIGYVLLTPNTPEQGEVAGYLRKLIIEMFRSID